MPNHAPALPSLLRAVAPVVELDLEFPPFLFQSSGKGFLIEYMYEVGDLVLLSLGTMSMVIQASLPPPALPSNWGTSIRKVPSPQQLQAELWKSQTLACGPGSVLAYFGSCYVYFWAVSH